MQTTESRKKDIISFFLKKGLLVNNELLEYLRDEQKFSEFMGLVDKSKPENITVLNDKIESFISQRQDLNFEELEKLEAASERSGVDSHSFVNNLFFF